LHPVRGVSGRAIENRLCRCEGGCVIRTKAERPRIWRRVNQHPIDSCPSPAAVRVPWVVVCDEV